MKTVDQMVEALVKANAPYDPRKHARRLGVNIALMQGEAVTVTSTPESHFPAREWRAMCEQEGQVITWKGRKFLAFQVQQ